MSKYARFGLMIATSTVVMFGLMYLNTYRFDHVFFSETRVYMAFVMGATMGVIMLLFMLGMYDNKKLNAGILIGSVAVFAAALWLVRSQTNDSASLDRDHDERTGQHFRPAGARAGRWNHCLAAPGDPGDEGADLGPGTGQCRVSESVQPAGSERANDAHSPTFESGLGVTY